MARRGRVVQNFISIQDVPSEIPFAAHWFLFEKESLQVKVGLSCLQVSAVNCDNLQHLASFDLGSATFTLQRDELKVACLLSEILYRA